MPTSPEAPDLVAPVEHALDAGTAPDRDLIAKATALVPFIRERATAMAAEGRTLPDVIEALSEAGMYAQLVPKRLGGQGTNMRTLMECIAELARGDGGTGWAVALSNAASWVLGTFPDEAQPEIFAEPNLRSCNVFTPAKSSRRVDGGYVISGSWPYASGSSAAQWATVGMLLEDGSQALVTVPPGEFSIDRSWDVLGMKSSGSDTVVIDEAFVPDRRIVPSVDIIASAYPTTHREEQTARMSFFPTWALPLIAVQVGLGRHALEISLERVPERSIAYSNYTHAKNSPTHQVAIAEAAGRFDLSELLLQRASGVLDAAAVEGRPLTFVEISRTGMDISMIAELVNEGMDRIMNVNGSSAFTESSLLGRIWRDAAISLRHVLLIPQLGKERYGQALLGTETDMNPGS